MDSHYFMHAPMAHLVIDPIADRIVAVNEAACRLLQNTDTVLRQQRASRLFALDLAGLVVFSEEVMTRGYGSSQRLLVRCGEHAERMDIHARCLATDPITLLLCLQPLKEWHARQEQLEVEHHYQSGIQHWHRVAQVFQEFERQNQLLLDAAGEGIYGVDEHGCAIFINPAGERILGYRADELTGKNIHDMVHHSHEDGSHFPIEDCPIFTAFRDGDVHMVDDDVFWAKDGRAVHVEYTSTPVYDNGRIVGAVVVFRDVTQKKADHHRLLAALAEVEQLKHRLELENAYLQEEINSGFNHHQIIGQSAAVQHTVRQIQLVAATDATVLIQGESGTGKELIARAIHETSSRSRRSLIRVNCAAIPADLFESEFFGHVKGSFTGAVSDRPGRFEVADGGTLFLDEVGEIPLHLQGKLLRVLQEQQFERVGEARTRHVDVRIIAATNRDLKRYVDDGQFREDLYFRLNVFPIESVPLRRRRDDIPLLARHFLDKACTRMNKPGLKISLSQLERLMQYHWPGNIRELENVIERQVILTQGPTLQFSDLQWPSLALPDSNVSERSSKTSDDPMVLSEGDVRQQQQANVLAALSQCQGRIFGAHGAAALLGIPPTTLASRLRKWNIDARQWRKRSNHEHSCGESLDHGRYDGVR